MVIMIKCVLMGDGAVGKTALRERYLGKGFKANYMVTIGADFALADQHIQGKDIKFQIWDLAGQPRFSVVRSIYYTNCLGALAVFDCTRPDSFKNLSSWIEEYWNNNGRGVIPLVILGNKADLKDKFPNHVSNEVATDFVEKLTQETEPFGFKIPYLETSAKTGLNVDAAFDYLGMRVLEFMEKQKASK